MDYFEQLSCKGKKPYKSKKHATNDARALNKKSPNKVVCYFCEHCHYWHVGNKE